MRTPPPKLRLAMYWGLPAALLYLIFRQLDLARLADLATTANAYAIAGGISLVVPKIIVGGWRWYLLAERHDCTPRPFPSCLATYWSSLAIGAITPGYVGSDIYRIAVGGRRNKRYGTCAFVIFLEKIAALASCVGLVACTYPFIRLAKFSAGLSYAIDVAFVVLIMGAVLLGLIALTHRTRWFERLLEAVGGWVSKLSNRAVSVSGTLPPQGDAKLPSPAEILRGSLMPRAILPALALSFLIHLIGAVQGQLWLHALGYDLPFVANVFVAPVIALVLMVPMTVGGFGVREGIFILCYGAFGVPAEIGLLVSFFFLISVTAGHGVGALVFLLRGPLQVA